MYIQRIINSVFTSNTYILTGESESAFLIDVGDVQPVKELLDKAGKSVSAVSPQIRAPKFYFYFCWQSTSNNYV